MSESTVETTTNGPSLESILWAAAERWSDDPGLVDRDEFANYIFDAWGAESPTEEFVSRFFDGDPSVARPHDMAEAVSRASRGRMHVYNFDLNRLEYVVIEDEEQVVLVSEQGQFALPSNDFVMRAIERAIIPGSTDPVATGGQYDRKQDGTPRAYFVRKSGEIVAVDVDQLSRTVQQAQLDLKPVFSPVIEDAEGRLMPFNPTRTVMMPNREVDLLRQDKQVASWVLPPERKRLVSPLAGVGSALDAATGGLKVPQQGADTSVLLLLPDGTLARPVIGSGSRWRDMVSDWTARAAMLSYDATATPAPVMDDRRYAIQTDRVMAIFSGVRSTIDSSDAPGEMGLTSQTRGEAMAAVRMLDANIRILGDDDLAQAILGGAQFVSGLAAPIMADTRPGTGFWLQPEMFFQPSSDDRDYASREMDLRSAGYSNASLETQLAAPQQELVASQSQQPQGASAAADPWSSWALQAGGDGSSSGVGAALIGRDVDGGTVGPVADPSAMALFARRGRGIGSALDGGSSDFAGLVGGPLHVPSERVVAFRAPDGALIFQSAANTQVRLASVHRSVGAADDDTSASTSSTASALAAAPRPFSASIGLRSGALPATALAALATALDRTAAASGYKLPRLVSFDSAEDALDAGQALSSSLPEYAPRRSRAMLTESPLLTGSVGRMVLSMPFPTAGEVVVGADLDEALKAWMVAPAISVGDATSSMTSSSSYSSSGGVGASGAMLGAFGGAASGAIAGDLALHGGGVSTPTSDSTSSGSAPNYNMGPSLSTAALVSGGAPAPVPVPAASPSLGGQVVPDAPAAGSSGTVVSSSSGGVTNFGTNTVSGVGGTSYLIQAPARAQASSVGAPISAGADAGTLHGAALGRAQQASYVLQMPGAADTLSSRSTLARLPKLLSRALESSGGWLPGAGTPLPSPVREFALSGPFDLPELAAIGAFPEREETGLISTRVLNPGEEEIQIPMPLWTQMGRGRLSSTEAVMASPRMRPGFAPPLGVYRLVAPEMVDFTGGAPESTPGVVTLQGPTEMGLQRSLAGGVEANKMGGQFVLGRIPLADPETVVSRRGRIRIGAPLSSGDNIAAPPGSLSGLASLGQTGSFATGSPGIGAAASSAEGFGGLSAGASGAGDLTSGAQALQGASSAGTSSSALSSGAMLGGDAPAGALVSSGAPTVLRVPIPDVQALEMSELELDSTALAPSATARPFASALRSALRMSDDVGSRMIPSGSTGAAGSFSSGGAFSGASWSGSTSLGSESLVAGQPMLGSGGGIASGVSGPSFGGGGMSSLVSSAPQGSVVAGGSSAGSSSLSAISSGTDLSGASLVSGASAGSSGGASSVVSGLPAGAWSGAKRDDGDYTPWIYGSRFAPSEQSRGGVDLFSGSRLNRPNYPALPAMLRFRYIGAPLWWSTATGSWASGTGGDTTASTNGMARSLRSGLGAANSAAAIWRSIFVNPSRQQQGPGAGSNGNSNSDAGTMDHTWDRNADTMASLSSKMALIAVGMGGSAGASAAGGSGAALTGPETVYVAMDSSGRAGTTTSGGGKSLSPTELSMKIVAAIPPSPPPLADMAAASSTNVEARPRHSKASAGGHGDEKGGAEGGVSRSKIEGSVDAIAQRIYHRIVRRLDSDRERFGG